MDASLQEMLRRRDELKKRLEEKQRLFDLIQNPKNNNTIKTQDLLKRNNSAKTIQVTGRWFRNSSESIKEG